MGLVLRAGQTGLIVLEEDLVDNGAGPGERVGVAGDFLQAAGDAVGAGDSPDLVDVSVFALMVWSHFAPEAERRGEFLRVCFTREICRNWGRKVFGGKGLRFCAGVGLVGKEGVAAGVDWA